MKAEGVVPSGVGPRGRVRAEGPRGCANEFTCQMILHNGELPYGREVESATLQPCEEDEVYDYKYGAPEERMIGRARLSEASPTLPEQS